MGMAIRRLCQEKLSSMDSFVTDSDKSLFHVPPQYTLYLNTTILNHGPVTISDKNVIQRDITHVTC